MTIPTTTVQTALLDSVDWHAVAHVVAVGGGDGAVLAMLLQEHPWITGVLFDEPTAVAGAAVTLAAAGVAHRVDVETGDLLGPVPPGGDLYLLVGRLTTRPGDETAQILRRCHAAMAAAARLVVCEPDPPACWPDVVDRTGFEVVSTTESREWLVVEARPRRS